MADYATLDQSHDEDDLEVQMASGQFAVLSGRMFEYRDLPDGDDKVGPLQSSERR
jgi:hypothetical protein